MFLPCKLLAWRLSLAPYSKNKHQILALQSSLSEIWGIIITLYYWKKYSHCHSVTFQLLTAWWSISGSSQCHSFVHEIKIMNKQ